MDSDDIPLNENHLIDPPTTTKVKSSKKTINSTSTQSKKKNNVWSDLDGSSMLMKTSGSTVKVTGVDDLNISTKALPPRAITTANKFQKKRKNEPDQSEESDEDSDGSNESDEMVISDITKTKLSLSDYIPKNKSNPVNSNEIARNLIKFAELAEDTDNEVKELIKSQIESIINTVDDEKLLSQLLNIMDDYNFN